MEIETGKALLIVSIKNPNRLSAGFTRDYFLVDIHDYSRAVDALRHYEDSIEMEDIVDTTSGAIAILNNANINFEHVIEGRKFFFTNEIEIEEEMEN